MRFYGAKGARQRVNTCGLVRLGVSYPDGSAQRFEVSNYDYILLIFSVNKILFSQKYSIFMYLKGYIIYMCVYISLFFGISFCMNPIIINIMNV